MRVLYFVHTYKEPNGIAVHIENIVRHLKCDVEIVHGKGFSLPFFSSLRIPVCEFFEVLGKECDIIHVHGYGNFFSFFGALLSVIKRKPLVWTVHGYPEVRGIRRIAYYIYKYLMAPLIFLRANVVITVSNKALEKLKKETDKKVVFMPNGVDLSMFKPKSNYKKAEYICYVGRLERDKGVLELAKTKLPLMFIGKDEENLKDEIRKLNKRAVFTEVDYKNMPQAYEQCRYVVLPSLYEGFPLVMLESIAMKRPFVSTGVGHIPIVLGDLFDKPDKYIIKSSIESTIMNLEKHDLSKELEKARKRLRKYSWKSIAEELEKIYKMVLSEKSQR